MRKRKIWHWPYLRVICLQSFSLRLLFYLHKLSCHKFPSCRFFNKNKTHKNEAEERQELEASENNRRQFRRMLGPYPYGVSEFLGVHPGPLWPDSDMSRGYRVEDTTVLPWTKHLFKLNDTISIPSLPIWRRLFYRPSQIVGYMKKPIFQILMRLFIVNKYSRSAPKEKLP